MSRVGELYKGNSLGSKINCLKSVSHVAAAGTVRNEATQGLPPLGAISPRKYSPSAVPVATV